VDTLILEHMTDTLSRNVDNEPTYVAQQLRRATISFEHIDICTNCGIEFTRTLFAGMFVSDK